MEQTNLAFYRKYRPQTLTEIIGQQIIKQTLEKAYLSGRLSHAYLFCGPKGTGKTSTARILAKLVNCEADKNAPCNKCSFCLSVTDGSSLDLIEIDAASNRGIDDIRELRDKVKLAPSSSKKKVYIIDEVHMLTTEAFNALLKTLEEPPAHVLFVLATTDPQKIPQTILSRVQRLDFQTATPEDLSEALKRVVEGEKLDIEEAALKFIAKKADGSFRDCLKLLDQLSSNNEKITLKIVEESLKSGDFDSVISLIEILSDKDSSKALDYVNKLAEKGISLKEYILNLMDYLRLIMLIKHKAVKSLKDELSEEKYQTLDLLSQKFSSPELVMLLDLFIKALEKMRFASIQSLPLEIVLVEFSESVESVKSVVTSSVSLSASEGSASFSSEDSSPAKPDYSGNPPGLSEMTVVESKIEEVVISKPTDDVASSDMVKLADKWNYILETIKPYNYSLEALLRQVRIVSCEDSLLIFEVPYSFHQRILEQPKSRDLLESVISDVLAKAIKVKTILGKRPVKVEELANIEVAADDEIIKVAAEIFNSDSVN